MKKALRKNIPFFIFIIIVCVAFCLGSGISGLFFVRADASGNMSGLLGRLQTWEYYEGSGTLNITGSGIMNIEGNPWSDFAGNVKTVNIGEGIKTIDNEAFSGFSSLIEVNLPSTLTIIFPLAFSGCNSLSKTNFNGTLAQWCNVSKSGLEGNPVEYSKKLYLNGNLLTDIKSADLYGVTEIKTGSFQYNGAIRSIEIPDNIKEIYSSFEGCTSLTKVNYIGRAADWCSIYFNGFNANPAYIAGNLYISGKLLTEIKEEDLSGAEEISGYSLAGLAALKSVRMPNGIVKIGSNVFYGSNSLETVTIPDSVREIGTDIFANTSFKKDWSNWESDKSALYVGRHLMATSYASPSDFYVKKGTLTTAGSALSGRNITSLHIPEGVLTIGRDIRTSGYSIVDVYLPKSINRICEGAFYSTSLKNVYYSGTPEDKELISVDSRNEGLENATWHFNYIPPNTSDNTPDNTVPGNSGGNGYPVNSDTKKNPTAYSEIIVKSGQTVNYKSNVTVIANAKNVPKGYYLTICDGGKEKVRGNNKTVKYNAGVMTDSKIFKVRIVDAQGKEQYDSGGEILQKDLEVKVKTDIISKIIAFFRNLFSGPPTVEIKP